MAVEQPVRECLSAKAGFADIDHDKHAAIGFERFQARAIGQAFADQVATLTIRLAHRRQFRQLLFQGHHGGVLDKVRRAIEHAQRKVFQVAGQGRRADHPAHSPTGHGMRLGQAVEGRRAFSHTRQAAGADVLAFVQQFAVDLIGDQPQVMSDAQLSQGLPGAARQACTRRVVRAVQGQRAGAWADARGDILRAYAKTVLRAHRHRHHCRPASAEHRFVGDIHRLGDNHLIPRIEQALGDAKQRALRTGQHRHLIGTDCLAAALLVSASDGLAQGQFAAHVGIMRMAALQAVDSGLNNRRRGVEIRITDRQQKNVLALRLQFQGSVVNIPGGGAVTGNTLSQIGKAHGNLPELEWDVSEHRRA
ncbi:hypothetical protein D3C77_362640 [compost metagenome]